MINSPHGILEEDNVTGASTICKKRAKNMVRLGDASRGIVKQALTLDVGFTVSVVKSA